MKTKITLLLATFLLTIVSPMQGKTTVSNSQVNANLCNPIMIYPNASINEYSVMVDQFFTATIDIENIFYVENLLMTIEYNEAVITPHYLSIWYSYGNDYYMDYNLTNPGVIEIEIYCFCFNSWITEDICVTIQFFSEALGYSPLHFSEFGFWGGWLFPEFATDGNVTISSPETQTIHLDEGWTGFSSYLLPEVPLTDLVLQGVWDNTLFLWNYNGYYDACSGCNLLPYWDHTSGYYLKSSEESNLFISGAQPEDKQISLQNSWNLLPVLSLYPANIEMLFGENIDKVEIIKELKRGKCYWPEKEVWKLQELLPGKTYWVKMNDTCTISY
jgi:hypothetical protein